MRQLTLGVAGALCAVALSPTAASADPVACQQFDSHGICIVRASEGPGSSTQPAMDQSERPAEADSSADACTLTGTGTAVPCQDAGAWWLQSLQCYAELASTQPPKDAAVWGGHTDGAVYSCTFYSADRSFPGTSGFSFWSATPPTGPPAVDPEELAREALQTLVLPSPTTGRYPAGTLDDGRPFTVVNAATWFWTDPASFQALTATADAGGVWAQVAVEPTSLSFTPGDGEGAVSCPGPGVAWQPAYGVWGQSPGGCEYRYPDSSIHEPGQVVTAVYGIQWSVAWTSSTGASGELPSLTTTSEATFAVAEVEAVVTR